MTKVGGERKKAGQITRDSLMDGGTDGHLLGRTRTGKYFGKMDASKDVIVVSSAVLAALQSVSANLNKAEQEYAELDPSRVALPGMKPWDHMSMMDKLKLKGYVDGGDQGDDGASRKKGKGDWRQKLKQKKLQEQTEAEKAAESAAAQAAEAAAAAEEEATRAAEAEAQALQAQIEAALLAGASELQLEETLATGRGTYSSNRTSSDCKDHDDWDDDNPLGIGSGRRKNPRKNGGSDGDGSSSDDRGEGEEGEGSSRRHKAQGKRGDGQDGDSSEDDEGRDKSGRQRRGNSDANGGGRSSGSGSDSDELGSDGMPRSRRGRKAKGDAQGDDDSSDEGSQSGRKRRGKSRAKRVDESSGSGSDSEELGSDGMPRSRRGKVCAKGDGNSSDGSADGVTGSRRSRKGIKREEDCDGKDGSQDERNGVEAGGLGSRNYARAESAENGEHNSKSGHRGKGRSSQLQGGSNDRLQNNKNRASNYAQESESKRWIRSQLGDEADILFGIHGWEHKRDLYGPWPDIDPSVLKIIKILLRGADQAKTIGAIVRAKMLAAKAAALIKAQMRPFVPPLPPDTGEDILVIKQMGLEWFGGGVINHLNQNKLQGELLTTSNQLLPAITYKPRPIHHQSYQRRMELLHEVQDVQPPNQESSVESVSTANLGAVRNQDSGRPVPQRRIAADLGYGMGPANLLRKSHPPCHLEQSAPLQPCMPPHPRAHRFDNSMIPDKDVSLVADIFMTESLEQPVEDRRDIVKAPHEEPQQEHELIIKQVDSPKLKPLRLRPPDPSQFLKEVSQLLKAACKVQDSRAGDWTPRSPLRHRLAPLPVSSSSVSPLRTRQRYLQDEPRDQAPSYSLRTARSLLS